MENLVKLLNEYEKSKYGISGSYELEIDDETGEPTGGIIDSSEDYFEVTSYYISMKIISKRFGFIERLVENDKIDESKIFCDQGLYYSLLCKLAISDTPIEDLISYLKE